MKTLVASIVGIFAVGLVLGSFVSGSSTVPEIEDADLAAALETAPLVDCGEGREALLEPVERDGKTSFKVRCVPIEAEEDERAPVVSHSEAKVVTQAPAPVVAQAPVRQEPVVVDAPARQAPVEHDVRVESDDDSDRSWKESAVVIGGAAGTGAGIGAIAKGGKGAAVGAAIGAATGAAYELIKRDKK